MGYHMDGYLALEFDTNEQAHAALNVINSIAAAWWSSQGYSVDNGELIGRNAASGKDEPSAARTVTWAAIEKRNDKFYIYSLSNDTRFQNWRDFLPEGVELPQDIILKNEVQND